MGKDKDKKKKKKDKKDKKKKEKSKDTEKESEFVQSVIDSNDSTNCKEHPNEPLTLFCETCNKCICNVCRENGSHKNVTHSCRDISSMYSINVSSLSNLIDSKLNVKKENITSQIDKINALISTARDKRLEIEIETHRDFDGILQRLKDEESRKLSILYVDLSTLRNVLTEIEGIIESTKNDKSDKQSKMNQIEFLCMISGQLSGYHIYLIIMFFFRFRKQILRKYLYDAIKQKKILNELQLIF